MRVAMSALQPKDSRHQPLRTRGRPKPRNLLGVMARHPALARAYFAFNGHLADPLRRSPKQAETVREPTRRGHWAT